MRQPPSGFFFSFLSPRAVFIHPRKYFKHCFYYAILSPLLRRVIKISLGQRREDNMFAASFQNCCFSQAAFKGGDINTRHTKYMLAAQQESVEYYALHLGLDSKQLGQGWGKWDAGGSPVPGSSFLCVC